jgi:hypothetical protein
MIGSSTGDEDSALGCECRANPVARRRRFIVNPPAKRNALFFARIELSPSGVVKFGYPSRQQRPYCDTRAPNAIVLA